MTPVVCRNTLLMAIGASYRAKLSTTPSFWDLAAHERRVFHACMRVIYLILMTVVSAKVSSYTFASFFFPVHHSVCFTGTRPLQRYILTAYARRWSDSKMAAKSIAGCCQSAVTRNSVWLMTPAFPCHHIHQPIKLRLLTLVPRG